MSHRPRLTGEIEGLDPWAVGMLPADAEFVREFLIDLNAHGACLRLGMQPNTARASSHLKLRKPAIAAGIARAMRERSEALDITAKTVLGEAFRCYLEAAGDRNWTAAAKFLEMVGRHVDVRAFRDRFAPGMQDDEEAEDLSNLSDEELETLARLSRKAAGIPDPTAPTSPLVN